MVRCTKCGCEISGNEPARWDGNERVCEACDRELIARADRIIAAGRPPRHGGASSGNTMGLVGFILSIVSLAVFFGAASPIALIFSLLGLRGRPRGLAIAGTVIGSVGTALFATLVGFFMTSLLAFTMATAHLGRCSSKPTPGTVIGTYVGRYAGGDEVFHLLPSGAFTQKFSSATLRYTGHGTWAIAGDQIWFRPLLSPFPISHRGAGMPQRVGSFYGDWKSFSKTIVFSKNAGYWITMR